MTTQSIPRSPNSKTDVQAASFSIQGPKGQNEDRLLEPFVCATTIVAAIADGVGGNAGGGRAAEVALETLKDGLAEDSQRSFGELFKQACQRMRDEAAARPDWSRMATTLSAIRLTGDTAEVAHVGDTRIYHLRGAGLVTRTRDQTEVAELLRLNVLTAEQAKRYPRRNVITSYLSPDEKFELLSTNFGVAPGDSLILLTDGVYNEIRKSEFVELHCYANTVEEFKEAVKVRLQEADIRDDSSFVAIRI